MHLALGKLYRLMLGLDDPAGISDSIWDLPRFHILSIGCLHPGQSMIAEAGPSGFYIDWDPGIRYIVIEE